MIQRVRKPPIWCFSLEFKSFTGLVQWTDTSNWFTEYVIEGKVYTRSRWYFLMLEKYKGTEPECEILSEMLGKE